MDVEKVLIKYNDILDISGIISYGWRWLEWGAVKSMMACDDAVEQLTDQVISFNGFFNYKPVNTFINSFKPILVSLLVLSIVVMSIKLITHKMKLRGDLIFNIAFALSLIVGLPYFMNQFNKITNSAVEAINGSGKSTAGEQIVKNNLADVYLYAKKDFKEPAPNKGLVNKIPTDNIKYIDYNQTITQDDDSISNDVMKYKLTLDTNGKFSKEPAPLADGFLGMGKEEYYRWHMNSGTVVISLFTIFLALVVTIVKVGRIIFELAFHKLFAMLSAVTDLTGGQRTKEIFKTIISSFIVIIFMSILLRLYTMFTSYSATFSADGGLVARMGSTLLLIAGSFALIDGPNIVEKILGIDAGLKSGWKDLASLYYGGKALASAGRGLIGGIKGAGNKIKGFGEGVGNLATKGAGLTQGIKHGMDSVHSPSMESMKSKDNATNNKQTGKGKNQDGLKADNTPPVHGQDDKGNVDGNKNESTNGVKPNEGVSTLGEDAKKGENGDNSTLQSDGAQTQTDGNDDSNEGSNVARSGLDSTPPLHEGTSDKANGQPISSISSGNPGNKLNSNGQSLVGLGSNGASPNSIPKGTGERKLNKNGLDKVPSLNGEGKAQKLTAGNGNVSSVGNGSGTLQGAHLGDGNRQLPRSAETASSLTGAGSMPGPTAAAPLVDAGSTGTSIGPLSESAGSMPKPAESAPSLVDAGSTGTSIGSPSESAGSMPGPAGSTPSLVDGGSAGSSPSTISPIESMGSVPGPAETAPSLVDAGSTGTSIGSPSENAGSMPGPTGSAPSLVDGGSAGSSPSTISPIESMGSVPGPTGSAPSLVDGGSAGSSPSTVAPIESMGSVPGPTGSAPSLVDGDSAGSSPSTIAPIESMGNTPGPTGSAPPLMDAGGEQPGSIGSSTVDGSLQGPTNGSGNYADVPPIISQPTSGQGFTRQKKVEYDPRPQLKEGYIQPKQPYTLGGQSRILNRLKETHARSHNTGYEIGRFIGKHIKKK